MNQKIKFLDHHLDDPHGYTFAIVVARFSDRWIWVRHRERQTWELPAGHVEPAESVLSAARRELMEETGAVDFHIEPVVSYQGEYQNQTIFGKLYFARIQTLGPLPEYEIAEIRLETGLPDQLTYPVIQPLFFRYVSDWYLLLDSDD